MAEMALDGLQEGSNFRREICDTWLHHVVPAPLAPILQVAVVTPHGLQLRIIPDCVIALCMTLKRKRRSQTTEIGLDVMKGCVVDAGAPPVREQQFLQQARELLIIPCLKDVGGWSSQGCIA